MHEGGERRMKNDSREGTHLSLHLRNWRNSRRKEKQCSAVGFRICNVNVHIKLEGSD